MYDSYLLCIVVMLFPLNSVTLYQYIHSLCFISCSAFIAESAMMCSVIHYFNLSSTHGIYGVLVYCIQYMYIYEIIYIQTIETDHSMNELMHTL